MHIVKNNIELCIWAGREVREHKMFLINNVGSWYVEYEGIAFLRGNAYKEKKQTSTEVLRRLHEYRTV